MQRLLRLQAREAAIRSSRGRRGAIVAHECFVAALSALLQLERRYCSSSGAIARRVPRAPGSFWVQ